MTNMESDEMMRDALRKLHGSSSVSHGVVYEGFETICQATYALRMVWAASGAVQAPSILGQFAHDADLQHTFLKACQGRGGRGEEREIDASKFLRLCRRKQLLDKTLTEPRVNLLFASCKPKGARRLAYADFLRALDLVAQARRLAPEEVVGLVLGEDAVEEVATAPAPAPAPENPGDQEGHGECPHGGAGEIKSGKRAMQAEEVGAVFARYTRGGSGEVTVLEAMCVLVDLGEFGPSYGQVPIGLVRAVEAHLRHSGAHCPGHVTLTEFMEVYNGLCAGIICSQAEAAESPLRQTWADAGASRPSPPVEWSTHVALQTLFVEVCKQKKGSRGKMDVTTFVRLCQEAGLGHPASMPSAALAVIVARAKQRDRRTMHYTHFLQALAILAASVELLPSDVLTAVLKCWGRAKDGNTPHQEVHQGYRAMDSAAKATFLQLFDHFDRDQCGGLTLRQAVLLLADLGLLYKWGPAREMARMLQEHFHAVGPTEDGHINFDMFVALHSECLSHLEACGGAVREPPEGAAGVQEWVVNTELQALMLKYTSSRRSSATAPPHLTSSDFRRLCRDCRLLDADDALDDLAGEIVFARARPRRKLKMGLVHLINALALFAAEKGWSVNKMLQQVLRQAAAASNEAGSSPSFQPQPDAKEAREEQEASCGEQPGGGMVALDSRQVSADGHACEEALVQSSSAAGDLSTCSQREQWQQWQLSHAREPRQQPQSRQPSLLSPTSKAPLPQPPSQEPPQLPSQELPQAQLQEQAPDQTQAPPHAAPEAPAARAMRPGGPAEPEDAALRRARQPGSPASSSARETGRMEEVERGCHDFDGTAVSSVAVQHHPPREESSAAPVAPSWDAPRQEGEAAAALRRAVFHIYDPRCTGMVDWEDAVCVAGDLGALQGISVKEAESAVAPFASEDRDTRVSGGRMYPAEVATLLRALGRRGRGTGTCDEEAPCASFMQAWGPHGGLFNVFHAFVSATQGRSAETLSGKGFKRLMEECSFLGADQPITRLTAAVIFARCRPRGEMHLRYEDFVAALGYVARLRSTSDIGAGAHGSVDLQAEMSGMVDLLTHHGIPYTVAYDLSRKSHPRARRSPPPSVRTVRCISVQLLADLHRGFVFYDGVPEGGLQHEEAVLCLADAGALTGAEPEEAGDLLMQSMRAQEDPLQIGFASIVALANMIQGGADGALTVPSAQELRAIITQSDLGSLHSAFAAACAHFAGGEEPEMGMGEFRALVCGAGLQGASVRDAAIDIIFGTCSALRIPGWPSNAPGAPVQLERGALCVLKAQLALTAPRDLCPPLSTFSAEDVGGREWRKASRRFRGAKRSGGHA
ncbi:hypothetical protein CYMTET_29144 [Cymbomonas tetramitiformis]|uniref:Uncharacterized protein n=1 Tax=Cymbomonas tetramitiformis TaxID=36881 RepID=A0AAE0KV90_9CHLO|nr:hypothetical protein CYMTET_29144 [Cymbomonas tetramitiformis]